MRFVPILFFCRGFFPDVSDLHDLNPEREFVSEFSCCSVWLVNHLQNLGPPMDRSIAFTFESQTGSTSMRTLYLHLPVVAKRELSPNQLIYISTLNCGHERPKE